MRLVMRTSIQQKILALLLSLALPPLVLVGWLGVAGLARARATAVDEGTSALRAQAETNLAERAADKARLYDQSLAARAARSACSRPTATTAAAPSSPRTPAACSPSPAWSA